MSKMRKNLKTVLIACAFIAAMSMPACATDITGVTGVNGVYDIAPETINNGIGFREYSNFNLDNGHVANLQYLNNDTFVNLVDNQININGIVNTVAKDGNFYNGNAVFISPNGMVVGASGVLNVGSLGVYAPNQSDYNALKNDKTNYGLAFFKQHAGYDEGGVITTSGKIISSGDVDIRGKQVDVVGNKELITLGNGTKTFVDRGGIILGLNEDSRSTILNNTQAKNLFEELVNADTDMDSNHHKLFSNTDGTITISGTHEKAVSISAPIKNFAAKGLDSYGSEKTLANFTGFANGHYYVNGDDNAEYSSQFYSGVGNEVENNGVFLPMDTATSYPDCYEVFEDGELVGYRDSSGTYFATVEEYYASMNSNNNSNITGVTGENGVYNIAPERINNSVGFREYTDFDLAEGNVANLQFLNNDTFVNLVDNQININGIVNTVAKDGNFYNGKAVFISPNGMVVGASGVLNVGSLGVYAPNQSDYNALKNDKTNYGLAFFKQHAGYDEGGVITTSGKIISSGDVDIRGKQVDVVGNKELITLGNGTKTFVDRGGIILGLNEDSRSTILNNTQAENLFEELVNADTDMVSNHHKLFSNSDGTITISGTHEKAISISAPIKNFSEKAAKAPNDYTGYFNGQYYVNGNRTDTSNDVDEHYTGPVGLWTNSDGTLAQAYYENGEAKTFVYNRPYTDPDANTEGTAESDNNDNIFNITRPDVTIRYHYGDDVVSTVLGKHDGPVSIVPLIKDGKLTGLNKFAPSKIDLDKGVRFVPGKIYKDINKLDNGIINSGNSSLITGVENLSNITNNTNNDSNDDIQD